ncbi:hypothetical protein DFH09DRAFT_1101831 [Mycena vulgaris]|nr:hypothetical protein DFH09DRAFT_1101831 [Mycena vulgaris]
MNTHNLAQLVKAGMPTFFSAPHNTWSTLDLVFASKGALADGLVKCWASPGHGSDHQAIHVVFDVAVVHRDTPLCRNFRAAEWKDLPTCLEKHIAVNPLPALPLSSPAAIDTAIVKDDRDDPSWAAMKEARNTYLSAIHREKRAHWKQYVADAPRGNIYKVAKYALDPLSASSSLRTPDLVGPNGDVASTPAQKAALLHCKFFPPAPQNSPSPCYCGTCPFPRLILHR